MWSNVTPDSYFYPSPVVCLGSTSITSLVAGARRSLLHSHWLMYYLPCCRCTTFAICSSLLPSHWLMYYLPCYRCATLAFCSSLLPSHWLMYYLPCYRCATFAFCSSSLPSHWLIDTSLVTGARRSLFAVHCCLVTG